MPQDIFRIYDGRTGFWQWDTGQKLIVLDDTVDQVHFSNKNITYAIIKEVYVDNNGVRICDIPDMILTFPKSMVAYAYVIESGNNKTICAKTYSVAARPVPEDYTYTDENRFKDLVDKIEAIEDMLNNIESADRPKITNITLLANSWTGNTSPYSQVVTVNDVTNNSKVDLMPTAIQLVELQDAEISLMTENNAGVVTVWAIGNKPTETYEMQALITEVTPV